MKSHRPWRIQWHVFATAHLNRGDDGTVAKNKTSEPLNGDDLPAKSEPSSFPIAGIGASAGGLEALKQFIDAMPARTNIAYVVVTHQQAGHVSLLPELLSPHTEMIVKEVTDGTFVEPNHIYIAPSHGQLHILAGTLQIIPAMPRIHLPIDSFFRSLAIDQQGRAIGIVLSGTGTDGTIGIQAIKGESGMVMAQSPETAKYDGMPRSAIATGAVDFVLPANEMPQKLVEYANGPYFSATYTVPHIVNASIADVMPKIYVLLRNQTRNDFSQYKMSTVRRRVERRMSVHQIIEPKDYLRFLRENRHELDVLFRELLIGVTSFFRDPEMFDRLSEVLAPLIKSKPDGYTFRIWSAGCSSGEEAYSLAIAALEVIERTVPHMQLQVFATDLDDRAIDVARRGVYPIGIAADVDETRLQRYFIRDNDHYRVHKELRQHVIFAPQNIVSDPPFTKLDLLACRNVLIYMDAELQKKLIPVFHYALKPRGLLLLGNSESIGNFADGFEPLDRKHKLYESRANTLFRPMSVRGTFGTDLRHFSHEITVPEPPSHSRPEHDLLHLLERRLLQSYVPPTVIASDLGEIVYIHGRTGALLEPAAGEPTNNVLSMARSGLQPTLSALMRRAAADGGEAIQRGIKVNSNGSTVLVDVVVRCVTEPESIRGLLLITFEQMRDASTTETFTPVTPKKKARGRAAELEQELQYTKESLQSTIEELETANEELQSSNEELQSTNEELQSTNEELETSKEELQSLNEELQTVNSQLQMKMDDLALVSDDMKNLLNNTGIATVFLDNDLHINRYTNAAIEIIKIIPTDVGRPIDDLVSSLNYDLVSDGRQVLDTLITSEKEVQTKDGRWFRVRLMPYRTSDNVIDGLVATFVDVTFSKKAEIQISEVAAYTQSIVDTMKDPILVLNDDLNVVSTNESFYKSFGLSPNDVIDRPSFELGNGFLDSPHLSAQLMQVLDEHAAFDDLQLTVEDTDQGNRILLLNGRRLNQATDLPGRILLTIQDITDGNPAAE